MDGVHEHGGIVVPAGEEAANAADEAKTVDLKPLRRRVVRIVPTRPTGFGMPGLFRDSGTIGIVDGGSGIAASLAAQLAHLGVSASVLEAPLDAPDLYGLIYLGGLQQFTDVDSAVAVNRDAFYWARAMGSALIAKNGLFVTVQDTGGDFGLGGRAGVQSWSAGLSALVKTVRLEWPTCVVKAIDMERGVFPAEKVAARIVEELTDGGPETEVGLLSNGQRFALVDVEETERAVESSNITSSLLAEITSESVWVVSGGARGVTAACLQALARQVKPKLVLLGRTTMGEESSVIHNARSEQELARVLLSEAQAKGESMRPKDLTRQVQTVLHRRDVAATLESLEAQGLEVKYIDVDVQDASALQHRLSEVRKDWGPITGVVHAAGVIADKPILEKTDDQFERVFATKVRGLQSLLQATADDPLQLICLFSSVAARSGNVGQSDYAMANEVLNKVAATEAANRPACRVKSIGWGPWEGGMVTPGLRAHFEHLGVPLIPIAAGAQHFVAELSLPETEVVVVSEGTASLLSSSRREQWKMELHVAKDRFACLAHHVIGGAPVLPVAFVMDWFVRAAKACRPDLCVGSCEDLRVMKGIRLEQFSGTGHRLHLTLSELPQEDSGLSPVSLHAELRSEHGTLHYQATLKMSLPTETAYGGMTLDAFMSAVQATGAALASERVREAELSTPPEGISGPQYNPYQDHLFHGPAFQAIANVENVTDAVVIASLKTEKELREAAPAISSSALSPILLDAGLQVARLWGIHRIGKKTLPTSVRQCLPVRHEVPVRCIVVGQSGNKMKTVTDVYLLSNEGHVVVALLGLEMHVVGGKDD